MSYSTRFTGKLMFPSEEVLQRAVAKMRNALADESSGQSFVDVGDLEIEGSSVRVHLAGSCPASMWEDTLGFLRILGEAAFAGSIKGYYEGRLDSIVEARSNYRPPPRRRPRPKRKRTYGGKKMISRDSSG